MQLKCQRKNILGEHLDNGNGEHITSKEVVSTDSSTRLDNDFIEQNRLNDLEDCVDDKLSPSDEFLNTNEFARKFEEILDNIEFQREHSNQRSTLRVSASREDFKHNTCNESMISSPDYEDEKAFDLSDCETPGSESVCLGGIINPNYPGFQHLADNFQGYSSYSLSEFLKESKDDDLSETLKINESKINNNVDSSLSDKVPTETLPKSIPLIINDKSFHVEIDEENNISSVIGDFDKEIKEELSHIFNDSASFQEDLNNLRRDIKQNLEEPIEQTINNISEVVNNIIKQLCIENYEQAKVLKSSEYFERSHNSLDTLNEKKPCQNFDGLPENIDLKLVDAVLSTVEEQINLNKYLKHENKNIKDLTRDTANNYTASVHDNKQILNTSFQLDRFETSTIAADNKTPQRSKDRQKGLEKLPPVLKSYSRSERSNKRTRGQKSSDFEKDAKENKEKLEDLSAFDVYSIETAMPDIDVDAIESHIRAAERAERRKRTDREEIRRRLALGVDYVDYHETSHTGKKPSLHSRLQNGKNLQICYMNEAISEFENIPLDNENISTSLSTVELNRNTKLQTRPLSVTSINKEKSAIPQGGKIRPSSLALRGKSKSSKSLSQIDLTEKDFFTVQARLQTEARIALAEAKEKAKTEMERTRRNRGASPVSTMIRASLAKAHSTLPDSRRRLSRHLLTNMNVAQLQIIVNELHGQVGLLSDTLVRLLLSRDELHMTQDSRLVDIEDLTRYLEMKQQGVKTKPFNKTTSISSIIRPIK